MIAFLRLEIILVKFKGLYFDDFSCFNLGYGYVFVLFS